MMKQTKKLAAPVGIWLVWVLVVLLSGCVAQQADVARIKRELDQKIAKLDASRTELQSAVREANQSLEHANGIIAQQRSEIKELIRARADVLDQVATLREGDLSQVRGDIDRSLHGVKKISQETKNLDTDIRGLRDSITAQNQRVEQDFQQLLTQVANHQQQLDKQGEKEKEFQQALKDFQGVLSDLGKKVDIQGVQFQKTNQEMDVRLYNTVESATQAGSYLKEMEKSVNTVVKALDTVNANLSDRVNEQERQLSALANRLNTQVISGSRVEDQNKRIVELQESMTHLQQALNQVVDTIGARVDKHEETLAKLTRRASGPDLEETIVTSRMSVPERTPLTKSLEPSQSLFVGGPQVQAEQQYSELQGMIQAGKFSEALEGFSEFLRQYPSSPLASNAQYWMGECYYAKGQYKEAIREFERVIQMFPQSNKVPGALLKIGYSHLNMQNQPGAKATFRQLVRNFPESPEAAKATIKLIEGNRPMAEPS